MWHNYLLHLQSRTRVVHRLSCRQTGHLAVAVSVWRHTFDIRLFSDFTILMNSLGAVYHTRHCVLKACRLCHVKEGGRVIRGSRILDDFLASKLGGRLICRSPYMRKYTVSEGKTRVDGLLYVTSVFMCASGFLLHRYPCNASVSMASLSSIL